MDPRRIACKIPIFILGTVVMTASAKEIADPHFAPVLENVMGVNRATEQVPCPASEKNDDAKTDDEAWRRGAKLPTLIVAFPKGGRSTASSPSQKDVLTYREVCENAREQNKALVKEGKKPRRFALVLAKMHLCDYMSKACISTARTFFDPCNKFISDNFVPFHARTYFDHPARPEGAAEMVKLYESPSGPRLTVIDLDTCEPLKRTVTENGESSVETGITATSDRKVGDDFAWRVEDRVTRFADMRAQVKELLAATPDAFGKIEKSEWDRPAAEMGCGEKEDVPMLKNPEFVPELRTLMNEQYKQVTGRDAAAKVRWPVKTP